MSEKMTSAELLFLRALRKNRLLAAANIHANDDECEVRAGDLRVAVKLLSRLNEVSDRPYALATVEESIRAEQPDFVQSLQGYAAFCEATGRTRADLREDMGMIASKLRDACFVIDHLQKLRDEQRALLSRLNETPAVAVPDGWQLVPKEPTEAMVLACDQLPDPSYHPTIDTYRAMLAAAPSAPAAAEEDDLLPRPVTPSKVVAIGVPIETLRYWRELVDLNPADLAPRIDNYLARVTPPKEQGDKEIA